MKRLHLKRHGQKRVWSTRTFTRIEVGCFALVVLIFGFKTASYVHAESLTPARLAARFGMAAADSAQFVRELKYFRHCPTPMVKVDIGTTYLCRDVAQPSTARTIYDTYPLHGNGREIIYRSLDEGDMRSANDFVHNKIDIARYKPVALTADPEWNEDPYNDRYWRLNYYSLRPVLDLLYAARTTHQPAYQDKLVKTVDSFVTTGIGSEKSWDDPHAVAFRTMALVDLWWKMREQRILSVDLSTKILTSLQAHGDYLMDRNHYEPGYNHGINEAAALYELAVSFPNLPHASDWQKTGTERIGTTLDTLIDKDGALVENSPYYHFYVLQKYWAIYQYSQKQTGKSLTADFKAQFDKMVDYATYILQPNNAVPLLGASMDTFIHRHNEFREIAEAYPQFMYVLSQGQKGKAPPFATRYFASTGQTVMRSGWGKGADFANQTQLVLDEGASRTNHSDLDALSFSLYANGKALLPDSGLYTYDEGPMRAYFHGTAAHNTVVVDDRNQARGSATAGSFTNKDGYVVQTAQQELNEGVVHRRSVIMVDRTHFLVIDKLTSDKVHTYKQMFHVFPGAHITKDGLTVTGTGTAPGQSITIKQLNPAGITEKDVSGQTAPPLGICSSYYGSYTACDAVAYAQTAKDATYTTLLTIGPEDPGFDAAPMDNAGRLAVTQGHRHVVFTVKDAKAQVAVARATNPKAPSYPKQAVAALSDPQNWSATNASMQPAGNNALTWHVGDGAGASVARNAAVRLDLSKDNISLLLRVSGREHVTKLLLTFLSGNGSGQATNDLLYPYRTEYGGEWVRISLGKGADRQRDGHWVLKGSFDWSHIDGVQLTAATDGGGADVELGEFDTITGQQQPAAVIVFDDGYESILPAADYLHKQGFKANVAVIAKYTAVPSQGHLTLADLKKLQNEYGWNMVSHSEDHVDAVEAYVKSDRLDRYESDLLDGAKFLADNGLNSAPNWYVYPHGSTDAAAKRIVSKYYKFARTTTNEPEVYPFGDPYMVKVLSVRNAADGDEQAQNVVTTPQEVAQAVSDAKRFNQTLFLTFHRIHTTVSDKPGYEMADFKQVVDNLKQQHMPVVTLSELDHLNGVPEDNRIIFGTSRPEQIAVTARVYSDSPWQRFRGLFGRL